MASPAVTILALTLMLNLLLPRGLKAYVWRIKPLNVVVPYAGATTCDTVSTEEAEPAIIVLPPGLTQKEQRNILIHAHRGVGLTGSAARGQIGPILGLLDMGESDDSYLFRVSLPGVSIDQKDFRCQIEPNGKIVIEGVTTMGEATVCKNSFTFVMQTQNLGPPGPFSIEFCLAGPVDNQQFSGYFGCDGFLEGIVKKRM